MRPPDFVGVYLFFLFNSLFFFVLFLFLFSPPSPATQVPLSGTHLGRSVRLSDLRA